MRRAFALALLTLSVIAAFFVRQPHPAWVYSHTRFIDLMRELRRSGLDRRIGPFELVGAWQITSPNPDVGNFSGLAQMADGRMVSQSDRNAILFFTRPDLGQPVSTSFSYLVKGDFRRQKIDSDAESITIDPTTRQILLGYEGIPRFHLFSPDLRHDTVIKAPVLNEFPENQGPEAMRRLADGRTVLIGEAFMGWLDRQRHQGMIWPGLPRDNEPPQRFTLIMPEGFRPTELAQLPDGRLLLLGRTLTLAGFRTLILMTSPAAIRPGAVVTPQVLARIDDPRIRDNYEGMFAMRERDGSTAVWIISDSNDMVWYQRTLLLKLRFDSARVG